LTNIDDLPSKEKYWINYYYNINPYLLNKRLIERHINYVYTESDESKFDFLSNIVDEIHIILKKERKERKIKQAELSESCGLTRSTVSMIENGSNCTLNSIRQYINELKEIHHKSAARSA